MKERIKKLRKTLGLTQQEFADRIGISRGNIATYETRDGSPGSSVITLICREFNVSETWLRTGDGEMFVELPRNEALAAQIEKFLQGGTDSFRERLVSLLIRLSPEQWDALEGYLLELMAPRAPSLDIDADLKTPTDMTSVELHTELDRQLLEQEKAEGNQSASGHGNFDTVAG